jgi:hypothetical protein
VSSRTISLLPAKITAAYATLDELCVEKIAIAEELQALLNRTKLRLDMEAAKVRALNGTADEPKFSAPVTLKRYATTPVLQEGYAQTRQLTELRNALTADLAGNEPANKSNITLAWSVFVYLQGVTIRTACDGLFDPPTCVSHADRTHTSDHPFAAVRLRHE